MSKSKSEQHEILRLKILFSLIVAAGLLLVSRLFFIQIVEGEEFAAQARDQYIRPAATLIDRGNIYLSSQDGAPLPVATIKKTYTIYINPRLLENPEDAYQKLDNVFDIDRDHFFERASKKEDPYEVIASKLPENIADEVRGLGITGVGVHDEPERDYPAKTLAAHVIGFMSYTGDLYTGTHGIERSMNDVLSGPEGRSSINVFAEILSNLGKDKSEASADVVLTIDSAVQNFVERHLREFNAKYGSEHSGIIIMDPETGAIIAMASDPTYDLNEYSTADPSVFANPNVEQVFEMGSIIKPLTIASGIDAGAIRPNTHYQDNGKLTIDGYTISNYDGIGRGWVDMQTVLSNSLNTGVAFAVGEMGKETFREYFKKLFSGKTGIDLPFETENLIDNLNSPRDIEYATASYGQGIALSPISTARALAALGNGGLLVEPYVVKEIRYDSGEVVEPERSEPERVFSEESSETISRMLVRVFDNALLSGTVKIDTHTIAAKTGTAQVADRVNGGYLEHEFLHSFFGYFPAYDPEFIVLLYTMKPQGVLYASHSLTDPFMDIANFLIDYYEVPPDR